MLKSEGEVTLDSLFVLFASLLFFYSLANLEFIMVGFVIFISGSYVLGIKAFTQNTTISTIRHASSGKVLTYERDKKTGKIIRKVK